MIFSNNILENLNNISFCTKDVLSDIKVALLLTRDGLSDAKRHSWHAMIGNVGREIGNHEGSVGLQEKILQRNSRRQVPSRFGPTATITHHIGYTKTAVLKRLETGEQGKQFGLFRCHRI